MSSPYDEIGPQQRWTQFAAATREGAADVQGGVRFTIDASANLASAGSCFAARIAERLRERGFRYLVTEKPPAWMKPEDVRSYGYEPFSARYGLIFTTPQLSQLFERAYGRFTPVENAWARGEAFVDPFRPRIVDDGFESVAELEADRRSHLAAVRRMFETVDVFIFTLGLTEAWIDRRDGAVYPIVPGAAGGTFDPAIHEFRNLTFAQTYAHLDTFLHALRAVNPRVRAILTVSPIPLGATMEPQHVVRSTVYSKSVLRAVAEEIRAAHDNVDYFASYEMVSQSFFRNDPFEADRRRLKAGVADAIVDSFLAHYITGDAAISHAAPAVTPSLDVRVCDEDVFAR